MARAAKPITLTNGDARLVFRPQAGRFRIDLPGRGGIVDATAAIEVGPGGEETYALGGCRLAGVTHVEDTIEAIYVREGVEIEVMFAAAPRPGAFTLAVAFTNATSVAIPAHALVPICFDERSRLETGITESRLRVFRNGALSTTARASWGSWSRTRKTRPTTAVGRRRSRCQRARALRRDDAGAGEGLLPHGGLPRRGAAVRRPLRGGARQETRAGAERGGARRGQAHRARAALFLGNALRLAQAGFRGGACGLRVACRRADRGRRFGEEPPAWRSWHAYGLEVTERDVVENVAWLAANRERIAVEAVEVSDGWQADVGDWLEANARFPRGMKALADDIRAARFTPAVALAPFVASSTSRVFAEHPDWTVKAADGSPVIVSHARGRTLFALDLTNPYCLGHVSAAVGTVVYDWGFTSSAARCSRSARRAAGGRTTRRPPRRFSAAASRSSATTPAPIPASSLAARCSPAPRAS